MIRESTADIIRRKRGMAPNPYDLEASGAEDRGGSAIPVDAIASAGEPDPADVQQVAAELEQQEMQDPRSVPDRGRPGSVPAQVGQAATAALPPVGNRDADELAEANEADRKSRFTAGMELAGRQLVGGITRTPVGQGIGAAPSQVPQAMAASKSRSERAAEVLRLKRQGHVDARDDRSAESEEQLRQAKIAELVRKGRDGGGDGGELASYKAAMSKRYPDAAELINSMTSMKGAMDLQADLQAEKGRSTTIDAAKIAAGATREEARGVRADAKETKASETEADQAILGHNHDPKIKVPHNKVSAIRDGIADAKTLDGLASELDGLVAKHGLEVMPGPVKSRMEALVKNLDVKAKGPAFAELGVLTGPDLEFLDAIIGDPTNWRTAFRGGAEDVRTRLDVFRKSVRSNLANKKHNYGYSEQGGAGSGTKTVGGVAYEKRPDGKWYPAGGK